MQWFRSLVFTSFLFVSTFVYSFVLVAGFWLPYRGRYAIARNWAEVQLGAARVFCGLGYVVEGLENIPPGGFVSMWKHSSAWETIAQMVIFPEGTRVAPGQTKEYGISGALLAAETGRKIVPVAHDAGRYWGRRGLLKKPGTIRVVIGPPIDAAGQDPRAINEATRIWIDAKVAELGA